VNNAIQSKMVTMLSDYAPQSRVGEAPSGEVIEKLSISFDPKEPATDPAPAEIRKFVQPVNAPNVI